MRFEILGNDMIVFLSYTKSDPQYPERYIANSKQLEEISQAMKYTSELLNAKQFQPIVEGKK